MTSKFSFLTEAAARPEIKKLARVISMMIPVSSRDQTNMDLAERERGAGNRLNGEWGRGPYRICASGHLQGMFTEFPTRSLLTSLLSISDRGE